MKASEVMTRTPAFCTPETNLGSAVEILWGRDCGILPVVDAEGYVVSVVTDRDICIALGTRNRLPGELSVADVATQRAICCSANEDVQTVLAKMAQSRIRRLPVVDGAGKLEGLLSMDDIVEKTHLKPSVKGNELTSDDVVRTLRTLYAPQLPQKLSRSAAV